MIMIVMVRYSWALFLRQSCGKFLLEFKWEERLQFTKTIFIKQKISPLSTTPVTIVLL